jgi:hypothetical protein
VSREEPGLIERILDLPADEDGQKAVTFARGLVLGALVGAAIAGSTIWQRRQANRRLPDAESGNRGRTTGEGAAAGGEQTQGRDSVAKP